LTLDSGYQNILNSLWVQVLEIKVLRHEFIKSAQLKKLILKSTKLTVKMNRTVSRVIGTMIFAMMSAALDHLNLIHIPKATGTTNLQSKLKCYCSN